jgi:hypothetical protein
VPIGAKSIFGTKEKHSDNTIRRNLSNFALGSVRAIADLENGVSH